MDLANEHINILISIAGSISRLSLSRLCSKN